MDDSSASAAAQVTLIGENAGAAGAMQDVLLQGFSRYQQRYFGDDAALYEQLKAGQKPTTLVIGCCDSRVHPPALLGTEPGEMFVVLLFREAVSASVCLGLVLAVTGVLYALSGGSLAFLRPSPASGRELCCWAAQPAGWPIP